MTVSLEKIYFNYILQNRKFYDIVQPYFFKNREIQFVYRIIQNYMIKNIEADRPSPRQILEMVSLEDKDGNITKPILKAILDEDLTQYDITNFIEPRFKTWILINRIKNAAIDVVDETRGLEDIQGFDEACIAVDKIRNIIETGSSLNFIQDETFGSDFDDPENHVQDNSKYKVSSGFDSIDGMLGGGWDIDTLNCLMAETSNGKSLWMQNFATRASDNGYNVLYITLEMSERKVMKRLGSMRLKIPINDYDLVSRDVNLLKDKISKLGKIKTGGDLFDKEVGKIWVKFWAAGTANINDFDEYIKKLLMRSGKKIDLLIVDYITLIAPTKGSGDTLYTRGKYLAEGLRALGSKYKCPVVTGIQVAKDAWNASDITLESVPESKAIAETADTFFAIIRTAEMKRINLYRLKLLKQRDGDFLKSQIKINLNPTYLTLENDQFIDI